MKPRMILMAGGAILLTAAGIMLMPRSQEAPPSGAPSRAEQAPPKNEMSGLRDSAIPPEPGAEKRPKQAAALTEEERTAIQNEIEQASVTYDAKALPIIEPYLLHPDQEVRQAAMNGMVILGDAAAAPLLRKAAEKAPTPQDAVALSEAADYVELPSGTFVPKDRTAPGTRVPADGKPGKKSKPRLTPSPKPDGSPTPAE